MTKVMVASALDTHFLAFASTVGPMADAYLLRVIQYAGLHGGLTGEVQVPRHKFGCMVLSTRWHAVGKAVGEKVYDALLESHIAIPWDATQVASRVATAVATKDDTEDVTGNATGRDTGNGRPDLTGPDPSPPSPSPGESDAPPEPGRPMRPRDRERFGKVLEYALHCDHARGGQQRANELRRRHRLGEVPDEEIRLHLTTTYAWITSEKLARWIDQAPRRGQVNGANVRTEPASSLAPRTPTQTGIMATGAWTPEAAPKPVESTQEIVERAKDEMRKALGGRLGKG